MERKISAIIVDDEQEAIDYLSILLKENCPEMDILETATQSTDAINKILKLHPDVLFLDIKIDSRTGFDLIDKIRKVRQMPHIIFVTAYNDFAIDAFKANATDYLLKPVDPVELLRAVNKFIEIKEKETAYQNITDLIREKPSRLRFNTRNGYIVIKTDEIVYCQSDGNYCEIFLNDNSKKVISYNLRNLLEQLPGTYFRRISRFHIINDRFLSEVDKGKHLCILEYGDQKVKLGYSPRLFND